MVDLFIGLGLGLLIGALLGGLGLALRATRRRAQLETALGARDQQLAAQEQTIAAQRERLQTQDGRLLALQEDSTRHQAEIGRLQTRLEEQRAAHEQRLAAINEARQELADRFKALAGEVVEKTSADLARQQQERLQGTIKPLTEHLEQFRKQIAETYGSERKERLSLEGSIRTLAELHQAVGERADRLARALTGQSKTRGDWGEMILARLLEGSGLRPGEEFSQQQSMIDGEDGSRLQPDVIVHLPGSKHVIIDSKVNLVPWLTYCRGEEEEDRSMALTALVACLRNHIRDLAGKRYHEIHGLDKDSIDFVLLFIPIEATFMEAVTADPKLYEDAARSAIILVSPTTLMAVLKTIAASWKFERQEKNALRIAKEAERMVEHVGRYLHSFLKVGERLTQAQQAYETANRQLHIGKGHLIGRLERLRELGIKASKKTGEAWERIELLESSSTATDDDEDQDRDQDRDQQEE